MQDSEMKETSPQEVSLDHEVTDITEFDIDSFEADMIPILKQVSSIKRN